MGYNGRESLSSGSSSFDSSNFSISSVSDGRETISSNSSLVEDSTISVITQVMGESIFEEEGGGEVECWGEKGAVVLFEKVDGVLKALSANPWLKCLEKHPPRRKSWRRGKGNWINYLGAGRQPMKGKQMM